MTHEEYATSQTEPDRIEGTERGKAAVREFLIAQGIRSKAPTEAADMKSRMALIANMIYLFMKYAIGEEVDEALGKNSEICVYAKSAKGDEVIWHNWIGSPAGVLHGVRGSLSRMCEKMFGEFEKARDE